MKDNMKSRRNKTILNNFGCIISNPDSVRVDVVISIFHLTHSLFKIADLKSVIFAFSRMKNFQGIHKKSYLL